MKAILFDFDNTIAYTSTLDSIRRRAAYDELTPECLAKVYAYKGVPEMLSALKAHGVRLGIVTNSGRRYLDRLLHHLGLENVFDTTVTYTEVTALGKKPSPLGLQRALENLGVAASQSVLYVGDENSDHEAAYKAGITPVMPSWATKEPVSTAPALELSTDMVLEYIRDPRDFKLFAERSAELGTARFPRQELMFLPLDAAGNVVTLKQDMVSLCLGRYFSQKSALTALLHDNHELSKEIYRKEEQDPFEVPEHWVDMLAHLVRKAPDFIYGDGVPFGVVTVIPAKQGKDPRLERTLDLVAAKFAKDAAKPLFLPNVFSYVKDAQSMKTLSRDGRSHEIKRALHLNSDVAEMLRGQRVLIIDDVITTGSTLERARDLALRAGAHSVYGGALAKTVSIREHERLCSECGRSMVIRNSEYGRFWGCSGYTGKLGGCTHKEPLQSKDCPKCGRPMRIRTNRFTNVKFWSCTGWRESPSCSQTLDYDPTELPT